jgi:hypothetical protein
MKDEGKRMKIPYPYDFWPLDKLNHKEHKEHKGKYNNMHLLRRKAPAYFSLGRERPRKNR